MKRIAIVLVLYKQTPAESVALKTFLASSLESRQHFQLIIYDNGPVDQRHLVSHDASVLYHHDPGNRKLYGAYSYALMLAEQHDLPWLMLLDQDTVVTPEYVREAIKICSEELPSICAITPRLIVGQEQRSPHRLRASHAKGGKATESPELQSGPCAFPLGAWNSGSLLNVKCLLGIGGFPAEFPLDNLDYFVFTALQMKGDSVFVMDSRLEHNLSVADLQTLSFERLQDKLASDLLFRQRFRLKSRRQLSLEFFRTGISLLRKLKDKRMGLICLRFSLACFSREVAPAETMDLRSNSV